MNVTFRCVKCDHSSRVEFTPATAEIICPHCGHEFVVAEGSVQGDRVERCLLCRGDDLFIRKNFSQRLGISIIGAGFVLSSIAWFLYRPVWAYAFLLGTAGIDLVLFMFVGNLLQCYRCHSEFRGVGGLEDKPHFSLETHERYRQQAARTTPQELSK